MPIPVRETHATDRPDLLVEVTDDGSKTFIKQGTSDSFHSGCGALSESRHVYLQNSGVAKRLCQQSPTRVLEVGLGTSMAMLLTLDLAIASEVELRYVALETDWVKASTLEFLNPREWVEQSELVDRWHAFREQYPTRITDGDYEWQVDSRRQVRVIVQNVLEWQPSGEAAFDAIYFDPFCPQSAPELWSADMMRKMRSMISESGRLATYACSRFVRDALEQSGWRAERIAGPVGGKREVLVAHPI